MNQPIHNSHLKEPIYENLKNAHKKILSKSDSWNWDTLISLTSPGLKRILHLNEIYKLSLNMAGDIFEFGCHYGASTVLLNNLKYVYEPFSGRMIHTFDTFEGLPMPDKNDLSSTKVANNKGDYNIKISNYDQFLIDVLSSHESLLKSISSKRSFSINKGLVEKTLPKFLKKNSSVIASLVIFDMDLYKPTLQSLELIRPHLIEGSIIVFDEILAYKQYPGEAEALKNCSYKENLVPISNSEYVPGVAIFRFKNNPL